MDNSEEQRSQTKTIIFLKGALQIDHAFIDGTLEVRHENQMKYNWNKTK
jgi:hypothetical protein